MICDTYIVEYLRPGRKLEQNSQYVRISIDRVIYIQSVEMPFPYELVFYIIYSSDRHSAVRSKVVDMYCNSIFAYLKQ